MPPKGPSKKTEQKAKAKIIEDKTFGLKNKNKSSKVSKFIAQVEANVKQSGSGVDRRAKMREEQMKKEKEAEKKRQEELAKLVTPVVQVQKVPFGVDPKTVLCQYFKAGACSKGEKCKFSHDPLVERKATKINLYEDARDKTGGDDSGPAILTQDTMADWDQQKLEQVVQRKDKSNRTTTEIVCKHFLEAIEQKKYGWFWECPNGGDSCKYRHALPPGFVLKSAENPKSNKEQSELTLEEFLEVERYRIRKETPVTAESFARWKQDRKRRAEEEERQRQRECEQQVKAGRLGNISGRDLFVYQPDLFGDDEEAADNVDYTTRVEDADVFLAENLDELELSSSSDQEENDQ